jgi:hypothetical protein
VRNVADENFSRENQNTYFTFKNFLEHPALYEIMGENMVRPDRPIVTI